MPHWNPSELVLTGDIQHSPLHCGEYIHNSVTHPDHTYIVSPFHPKDYHHGTLGDYLSLGPTLFDKAYNADRYVALYDVEKSVEQDINDWVVDVTNVNEACMQLGMLMDKYLSLAPAVYALSSDEYDTDMSDMFILSMDQEHSSIMALTAFELWVALDKLVVKKIPMLAKYSPKILIPSLELLCLHEMTHLHHLSSVYQYLRARCSRSCAGLLLPSNKFDDDTFPVHYCDSFPDLQQLNICIEEAMEREGGKLGKRGTACRALAKVVAFELQCPEILHIWHSAVGHLLAHIRDENHLSQFDPRRHKYGPEQPHNLLPDIPKLQPFLTSYPHQKLHLFQLAYFCPHQDSEHHMFHYVFCVDHPSHFPWLGWILDDPLEGFFTSNYVLSSQVYCPEDSSLDEYIALEYLRHAGSLRWINILQALHSQTLNFHSEDVYSTLADLTCVAHASPAMVLFFLFLFVPLTFAFVLTAVAVLCKPGCAVSAADTSLV